jgi:hypothetical protein
MARERINDADCKQKGQERREGDSSRKEKNRLFPKGFGWGNARVQGKENKKKTKEIERLKQL